MACTSTYRGHLVTRVFDSIQPDAATIEHHNISQSRLTTEDSPLSVVLLTLISTPHCAMATPRRPWVYPFLYCESTTISSIFSRYFNLFVVFNLSGQRVTITSIRTTGLRSPRANLSKRALSAVLFTCVALALVPYFSLSIFSNRP